MSRKPRRIMPIADRFWPKVKKTDGCWEWQATKSRNGYGTLSDGEKTVKAHRVSYELAFGPILDEKWVLHRCDNRGCVRPDHLFLGTRADNIADMMQKGRHRCASRLGDDNYNAKLTTSDVIDIRRRYQHGKGGQLASEFGVNRALIWKIVHRKLWAHVSAEAV